MEQYGFPTHGGVDCDAVTRRGALNKFLFQTFIITNNPDYPPRHFVPPRHGRGTKTVSRVKTIPFLGTGWEIEKTPHDCAVFVWNAILSLFFLSKQDIQCCLSFVFGFFCLLFLKPFFYVIINGLQFFT